MNVADLCDKQIDRGSDSMRFKTHSSWMLHIVKDNRA